MSRSCEFIKPVHQSEKGPTCPDRFFNTYRVKDRCNKCPKALLSSSFVPRNPDDLVIGYFATASRNLRPVVGRSISFVRAALKNNQ